jgi:FdhD protein
MGARNVVSGSEPRDLGPGLTATEIVRFESDREARGLRDVVVVEEPLEIRVARDTLVTTMRTPGQDHELALGFLFAEGLISGRRDVAGVAHCGRPGDEGWGNVIEVVPAPGTAIDLERSPGLRRGTLSTAACGVCGRRTIDDLVSRCTPLDDETRFSRAVLAELTALLRSEQVYFQRSGGLHAAGLATQEGRFLLVREDVGRHNAVDKLIGRLLLDDALPAKAHALVVSGRTSFEIVQKALAARIPLVIGVSAPSSLAVATAERAKMTLVGFARDGAFNVYAGKERVLT